jgi:lipid A ethanolaminephosphotransferase
VLLLHAMGSHGPTYHRRVPPDHAVFQPTCSTERIETCSDEQIVNAYDNSIRYTDYILDGLIAKLQARTDIDAVLLYVSDHGESLGENGLYLHGQPWVIAPAVQKKVPLLLWFSDQAEARLGVDAACLRRERDRPLSHDFVAHTLLGLGGVRTQVYRPALDIIAGCRKAS